jgi:hypothetical protein
MPRKPAVKIPADLKAEFDHFVWDLLRHGFQPDAIQAAGAAKFKRRRGRSRSRSADELRDVWLMVEVEKAVRTAAGRSGHDLSPKFIITALYKRKRIGNPAKVETACRIYDHAKAVVSRLATGADPLGDLDILGWHRLLNAELDRLGIARPALEITTTDDPLDGADSSRVRNPMPWVPRRPQLNSALRFWVAP